MPLLRLEMYLAVHVRLIFPRPRSGRSRQFDRASADRLLGLREIVVRRLADPLVQPPGLAALPNPGMAEPCSSLMLSICSDTPGRRRTT